MWELITKIFNNVPPENSNYSILYIEDDIKDRNRVEKIMTKRNIRVRFATDGETGLEMVHQEKPSLVLLDIVLPRMNGIEVCKQLKKDERTKNIPVIFLTDMDTPKNLIDCYEYGAEDFINKSISPRILTSLIELTLKEYSSP